MTANQPAAGRTPRRRVAFAIEAPNADTVVLVGDFNAWETGAHPMKRDAHGVWRRNVLLAPGRYEYRFVVDGRWVNDPASQRRCANAFGTQNDVVEVQKR